MNKHILPVALVCAAALATNCLAEQSGVGHYMSGQMADFSLTAPSAPGLNAAVMYLNYNDGDFGGQIAIGRFDIDGSVTVNSTAVVPVLIYAYPFNFLGGTLSSGIALPYVWVDVKAGGSITTHRPNLPPVTLSTSTRDKTDGLGDIELMPLMAGWTNGDIKISGFFNIWAPTGEYDKSQLANTGLGYWTFEPMVSFSWLSSKIGTEFTVFTALDFNTENTDANYQSGDIFHVDGTLAQHLPLFGGFAGVGATGFYLKQFTGDSGSGARLGSFEVESYGVGPTVSYAHHVGKSTLLIDASWLPQTCVENTTKGDFIWIKVLMAF